MDLEVREVVARKHKRPSRGKYAEFVEAVRQWLNDVYTPWVEGGKQGEEPGLEIPVPVIEEDGEVVSKDWASRVGGYVIQRRKWPYNVKSGYFKNKGSDRDKYPYVVYVVVKDE